MNIKWEITEDKAVGTFTIGGRIFSETWTVEDGVFCTTGKSVTSQLETISEENNLDIEYAIEEMNGISDPTDWMRYVESYGYELDEAIESI